MKCRGVKCEVLHLLDTPFCANRLPTTTIGLDHVTTPDVRLPAALRYVAITIAKMRGRNMSPNRERTLLADLQRSRYALPIVSLCIGCLAPFSAAGQKASGPPGPPAPVTVNKTCEGQTAQASSHQSELPASDGTNRLKLSTRTDRDNSAPEGQFCRREKSEQNSSQPSASSDHPDTVPEPEQSVVPPPVAQVTDGKLTIRANGQDFALVLESVRSVTGLAVEMPPGVSSDPVFLSVGPTSVTDALIALLDGTRYNYIIVGSEQDSRTVKKLILTERTNLASGTLVASTQREAAPQPVLYGGVQPDAEAEASEPPPPPPVPVQPTVIPPSVPTGINVQKMAAESGKSVGQVLDELQKRQQQVLDDQAASQSQSAPQQ